MGKGPRRTKHSVCQFSHSTWSPLRRAVFFIPTGTGGRIMVGVSGQLPSNAFPSSRPTPWGVENCRQRFFMRIDLNARDDGFMHVLRRVRMKVNMCVCLSE